MCSQSYFYNSQQFGLKSTLLGGAVTAGSSDLSMVYYNPAALKFARDKGFDLTLFMPSYSTNNYGDRFNSGNDLTSSDISLNPSLITYKTAIKDKIDIVFTLLQKDIWDNSIKYNNVETSVGLTESNSFTYDYRGDEKWFGLGSSLNLSDNVSVGLSQFWSFQNSDYSYSLSSETLNSDLQQQTFFSTRSAINISSQFSMITKIGFSFDRPHDRLGLVVTTPNYLAPRSSGDLEITNSTLNNGQSDLSKVTDFSIKPELNNPWQVDLGYAKILGDSSEIWLNVSFHNAISDYDIFSAKAANQNPLSYRGGIQSVTNFSVGYAKRLNKKFQFLSSVRTNFSSYKNVSTDQNDESLIFLERDRLQIALGAKIDHKNSSFVVGLDWGLGIGPEPENFDNIPNIDLLDLQNTGLSQSTFTLLLTYEFFLDTMERNISKMLDRTSDHEH